MLSAEDMLIFGLKVPFSSVRGNGVFRPQNPLLQELRIWTPEGGRRTRNPIRWIFPSVSSLSDYSIWRS